MISVLALHKEADEWDVVIWKRLMCFRILMLILLRHREKNLLDFFSCLVGNSIAIQRSHFSK
jgi:hypothetical protein